jgi:cold shock CspA family protein
VEVRGTIESFDASRGLGVLRTDDGVTLGFHCVDIADGTRSIDVGARVRAERSVGHVGHDEARAIETV